MNKFIPTDFQIKVVYEDAFCNISISEHKYFIFQNFHKLPEYRDLLKPSAEMILALACQWSCNGIEIFYLLEVEEGKILPSEDVTWVRKDVVPQLADAGITFLAYVSKNNLFRQFNHDNLKGTLYGRSLSLRVFQERQDALIWMAQVLKI